MNIGWNGTGYDDADYMAALNTVVLPVAREFKPDLVIISAGFDSALGTATHPPGTSQMCPRGP